MDTSGRQWHRCRSAIQNPSFSSSLLDHIYRSIDDQQFMLYTQKHSVNPSFQNHSQLQQDIATPCKQTRRRSPPTQHDSLSSSNSSHSSLGGFGFSSSLGEWVSDSRPKPIRATTNPHDPCTTRDKQRRSTYAQNYQLHDFKSIPKVKTKSRAIKIYGDLKKVKQPISPGGRLVAFLNSLFTTGNGKNTKLSSDDPKSHIDRRSKSANASTCSAASSFSSKTPSSRGKSSNNKKRSAGFFPVSVIVDQDYQPCGHKSLYGGDESNLQALKFIKSPVTDDLKLHSSDRIEEAARNLLRNYQKKVECEYDLIRSDAKAHNKIDMDFEDDDDEHEDVASHTSSDLFELENFSAIGMEKYRDELPVYETTTHLPISNGFHM